MDEEELKKLKEKKKESLSGDEAAGQLEEQQEQMRQQLKQIAKQILTDEARSRPELASQIELQLVQLHRAGQIKDKITDEQLKELLKKLQEEGDEQDIKYTTRG